MTSPDPTHCRCRLATLMAEENAQLAALEILLTQEYELLQARDAEGLERAGAARQQCIGHILRIEDERRALCRAAARGDDPAGLRSLLDWCDPTGLLVPAMQEYRDRSQRCREHNDRNGLLVNGRLQQQGRAYGPASEQDRDHGRKLTTRA
jgi:flagellar biosynthesis/type III secretory pathway chaperone